MRPTKDRYLMELAHQVATRGTCDRRYVGIVIATIDGHILTTGYNGSLPGEDHCDGPHGHLMDSRDRCVRTVHAESNAVAHAAKIGLSLQGSVAYCTCHPCVECAKLLIQAGVIRIYFTEAYHSDSDNVVMQLDRMYDERFVHFAKLGV